MSQNLPKQTAMSNEFLIIKLQNEGLLDLYCFYLKFKYAYANGVTYKDNENDLAKRTGLHTKTVKKKLAEMVERGWIKISSVGDFVVLGRVELMDKVGISRYDQFYKSRIDIHPADDVQEIKIRLQTKLIEANLRRQDHNDRNNNSGENNGPSLSCEGIGRILNVSAPTACRFKKEAVRLGLLEVVKQYAILARNVSHDLFLKTRDTFPVNCFWMGGRVVLRKAHQIIQKFWREPFTAFDKMEIVFKHCTLQNI